MGFSAMAFRSGQIGFDRVAGEEHMVLLLGGNIRRGCHASKTMASSQSGKTGCGPCCVVATYLAVPPVLEWGDYPEEEAKGMSIWQQQGPWAVRSFAAALYAQGGATLPRNWEFGNGNSACRCYEQLARRCLCPSQPR